MVNPKKDGIGVIVGRFQEYSLSDAHKEIIEYALDRHNSVIVMVGESQCRVTKHDPLNFEMRRQMIVSEFQNVIVLPIIDMRDDKEWSGALDDIVNRNSPPRANIVMYGSRDSFLESYCGMHKTQRLNIFGTSSSTVRRKEVGESIINSIDFRKGVIWATQNRYAQIIPTVDIAIVHNNSIVMIKKDSDNDMIRFIGGYVECIDDSDGSFDLLAKNAIKETLEEVAIKINLDDNIINMGSYAIDDWRYKNSGNHIMTTFFIINLSNKDIHPIAGDDADSIVTVNLDDIILEKEIKIVPEHAILLKKLKEYFVDYRDRENPGL